MVGVGVVLAEPELDDEPAAGHEQTCAPLGDRLRDARADERRAGLVVAHLRLERVDLLRRRRTAGSRRRGRSAPGERRRGCRARWSSTVEPVRAGVLGRERERVRRDVERGDARAGVLLRDGEGDRSGAGADVEDARRVAAVEEGERALDEDLRLGPRDERARVAAQGQAAEVPVAEDVGERLALAAARDEGAARGELVLGQRAVERV